MVRDLLIGYVPGKWLKDVDFSTLVHVSGSYVSESGKQRYDDRVGGSASVGVGCGCT